jgi:hypothetical protein
MAGFRVEQVPGEDAKGTTTYEGMREEHALCQLTMSRVARPTEAQRCQRERLAHDEAAYWKLE